MQENLVDPVLGNEGRIFRVGILSWAAFEKEFGPTKERITIFVDEVNGKVPKSQRNLYRKIEDWYPRGIPEILDSVLHEMGKSETAKMPSSTSQIQNYFQLETIDIRGHIRPLKCVLHYRTTLDVFDWYVRISRNYRVEGCGPRD